MAVSDEEDSEFERFLQESLSSSSASNRSYRNVTSRAPSSNLSGRGGARSGRGLLSLSNQWLEEEDEQEEERDGLKWLKPHSGAPQAGTGGSAGGEGLKLEVAVPTNATGRRGGEGEVEGSESVTYSSEFSKDSVEASFFQSSALNQSHHSSSHSSGTQPTAVGEDTLEEKADKEQFFAALEAGRRSPADYSELIRQLGDTGLSTLTVGSVAVSRSSQKETSDHELKGQEGANTPRQDSEPSETETVVSCDEETPSIKGRNTPSPIPSASPPTKDKCLDELAPLINNEAKLSEGLPTSVKSSIEQSLSSPLATIHHSVTGYGDISPSHSHTQAGLQSARSQQSVKEMEKVMSSPHTASPMPALVSRSTKRESDGLTNTSKSEFSSSMSSHGSLVVEEGRGFTLSPIHRASLTASSRFQTPKTVKQDHYVATRDSENQKSSSLLSPSHELVPLKDSRSPSSPTEGGEKKEGRQTHEETGEERLDMTSRRGEEGERVMDLPSIPNLEAKPQAVTHSEDSVVETEVQRKKEMVSLPLAGSAEIQYSPQQSPSQATITSIPTPQTSVTLSKQQSNKAESDKMTETLSKSSTAETHAPTSDHHLTITRPEGEAHRDGGVPLSMNLSGREIDVGRGTSGAGQEGERHGGGGVTLSMNLSGREIDVGRGTSGAGQEGERHGGGGVTLSMNLSRRENDVARGTSGAWREREGHSGGEVTLASAQSREKRGVSHVRDESLLLEAGEGLERELSELQLALEAAGLPGISGARQSDQSNDIATNQSEDYFSGGNKAQLGDVTKQTSRTSSNSLLPQGLEDTIRSLATEELTSITREMLFRRGKCVPQADETTLVSKKSGHRHDHSQTKDKVISTSSKTATGSTHKCGLNAGPITHKSSLPASKTGSVTHKTGLTHGSTDPVTHQHGTASRTGLDDRKTGLTGSRTSLSSSKLGHPITGLNSSSKTGRDNVRGGRGGGKRGGRGRGTVKVGGVFSEWEREELKRGMQEQEALICGYQKENERLYSQLTECQRSLRSVRATAASETQRLRTELANTRARLELKTSQVASTSTDDKTTPTTTPNNIDIIRITQLEDQLERSRDECRVLQRQVTQLKHSLHVSEEGKKTRADPPVKHPHDKEEEERERERERQREREREDLRDTLREKDLEIAQLKEKLATAQKAAVRRRRGVGSGSGDSERVRQLERQVRGLNDVIKKRYPNSLSALILAATTSQRGDDPTVKPGVKSSSTSSEVESQLKKMTAELQRRGEEVEEQKRKIETLQKKYSAMELLYEQQLSSLSEQLESRQTQNHVERSPKRDARGTGEGRGRQGEGGEKGRGRTEAVVREGEAVEQERGRREAGVMRDCGRGESGDHVATLVEGNEQQAQRVADRAEELVGENSALKCQLVAAQLEADHERVRLRGQLAEIEAEARAAKEHTNTMISALKQGHMTEVDSLKAQFARHHSQSEMAALRSQLSALQVECHLLKERLHTAESERETLKDVREREELLTRQIKQLSQQLVEAKSHHTPEMHHFSSLLAKITMLEARIADSELVMSQRTERLRQPAVDQIKQVELKWQRRLQAKDAEIAKFRAEMDTILNTLHALQNTPLPSSYR